MRSVLFFFSILAGYALMNQAWDGTVFVDIGEKRGPANVAMLKDLYPMSNRVLTAGTASVLDSLEFVRRKDEIGIRLGHFLIPDADGAKRFACQAQSRTGIYDRMELSFDGVGVSDDGKIPVMKVEADCEAEDDLALLNPIWIPMADIYEAEPHTQELRMPVFGTTNVQFQDLASEWPEKWQLRRIRFFNSQNSSPNVKVAPLIIEPTGHSKELTFKWTR